MQKNYNVIEFSSNVTFVGRTLSSNDNYAQFDIELWDIIAAQIEKQFPNQKNLLVGLTWFGPQFPNSGWDQLVDYEYHGITFDNIFFLATVDPPYLNVTELQQAKNMVQALRVYYLGNFDSAHQFNFFTTVLAKNFKIYTDDELSLQQINHVYINYNRKPKPHRVDFVKLLISEGLDKDGIITLGVDSTNDLYLSIGEKQVDYVGTTDEDFGIPMDYYTLHRLDVWKNTFLYVNASTEFNPINDLFCQQDTFKPMLGLRPFVLNGVQKTYRWLRLNGFKTFNHWWPHIDIENGDVHGTIIELLKWLKTQDLVAMYNDMLPDLRYNKERFFEFAKEQNHKINNLFAI